MDLQAATVAGLQLITPGTPSLWTHLDRTRTSGGRELLRTWLTRPLLCARRINERLDVVEHLVHHGAWRQELAELRLSRLASMGRSLERLRQGTAQLEHFHHLEVGVQASLHLLQASPWAGSSQGGLARLLEPLAERQAALGAFSQYLAGVLDPDSPTPTIQASFSDPLAELERAKRRIQAQMNADQGQSEAEYGLKAGALRLEVSEHWGAFYRVTLKDERCLRGQSHIHLLESLKSGVKFRNRALTALNDELADLELDRSRIIQDILAAMNRSLQGYPESCLQAMAETWYQVDCFVALALFSTGTATPYTRPTVTESKRVLDLVDLRHPLLEREDHMHFIPNSIRFQADERTCCILTGPNMGGKSTFLKSVGLTAVLAQIGCFVPCRSATLSPFDAISVRIGADDSLVDGSSTFLKEMLDIKAILNHSTEKSLVLIDELGRGTSTQDGFGLAWAICEHIVSQIRAVTLFATHFHELSDIDQSHPTCFNMNCAAAVQDGSFTLLYQIVAGRATQSFGVEVAELAKFPPEVIEEAKLQLHRLTHDEAGG
eukprot:maker-scaffold491_size156641-snap-gene-0.34 protein:Tk05487 transcript:maker-scaffold491_size156641-snap-gene-0.34-mRNA-1 annotation:"dna mismatch repair protein msh2 isoform x2"